MTCIMSGTNVIIAEGREGEYVGDGRTAAEDRIWLAGQSVELLPPQIIVALR